MTEEATTPPEFTEQPVTPEQIVLGTARLDNHFRKWLIEQLTAMGDGQLQWQPSPQYVAGFTEHAQQLVKRFILDVDTDMSFLDVVELSNRIASALAEAATQGQIVGIERAKAIALDFESRHKNSVEYYRSESSDRDVQERFQRIRDIASAKETTAYAIRCEIEQLSPLPDYLNRVRNEARAEVLAELSNSATEIDEKFMDDLACGFILSNERHAFYSHIFGHLEQRLAAVAYKAATAALEQATQVVKNRRSWYGEKFFGPMPSMENATDNEKRLVTLASANMARHTCDHLLTEIAAIGDDKDG